jgi:two-component system nitrate/nitrite response regulator NarL
MQGRLALRKRISLVLIDDNPSAPEGVASRIRAQPGFHVLAASAEIDEALRQVREARPELVLLNLRQKGSARLALAVALHDAAPESRLILMGLEPLHEDVASYVRAGASGFIMADADFGMVLNTLHSVAEGNQVLPQELAGSLFGQLTGSVAWRRRDRLAGLDAKLAVNSRLQVAACPLPSD